MSELRLRFRPSELKSAAQKYIPRSDISRLFRDEEAMQMDADGFITDEYRAMLLRLLDVKAQVTTNTSERLAYRCVEGILDGSRTNDLICISAAQG
ncbi:MAG: hypothetical protein A2751_04500 [Candidatus Doudnabacteria bacterium RIFCSPHIGHO2_01_FULL_46_14]|uniref:Uncharacterized protein n=1 Tax=Candidatus Doudnabacteria bacterium RIFCSPHIGHO2_01_FULL_46_14 TaxID=1817824 RepID=A0A1F5NNX2_9BACT|nr:MAG: hypothetical protein A2751_04500 [Candidatus Doudnabacteria bacterium RIFCSPHIGHO2_01_FULL_46_14]